jgi:hypothetical protein
MSPNKRIGAALAGVIVACSPSFLQAATATASATIIVSIPGMTKYNDNDPSIVYSLGPKGAIWSTGPGSGDFNNDEHYTNVYGSSFAVTFNGTTFQWIGKKGPNFGIANVYLDGTKVASVDNYSQNIMTQQVLYSVSGLASVPHTFKAAIGPYPNPPKNPSSTNTYQVMDAFSTSGKSMVLQKVPSWWPNVIRSGGWGCGNYPTNLSGGHCWSNDRTTPGSMSLTFIGTGIEVYGRPDGENGITDLYIDGGFVQSFDEFGLPYDSACFDCVNGQLMAVVRNLASGTHTIKLVVNKNKNMAASDYYTQIDEFQIIP